MTTITTEMIASALGVTDRRVRSIAKELNIKGKRLGRAIVFNSAQVKRMAKRNTKPGPKRSKR